jgi:hypothetical protein
MFFTFDEKNISIFPYKRDGSLFEPNIGEISALSIIGGNVLKLSGGDNCSYLFNDFKNFQSPNKIINQIKNLKNVKINKREVIFVGALSILLFTLVLFLIKPQYQVNDLLVYIPTILGSITLVINVIRLLKKEKRKVITRSENNGNANN